jgi:hypothetical protein
VSGGCAIQQIFCVILTMFAVHVVQTECDRYTTVEVVVRGKQSHDCMPQAWSSGVQSMPECHAKHREKSGNYPVERFKALEFPHGIDDPRFECS